MQLEDAHKRIATVLATASGLEEWLNEFPSTGLSAEADARVSRASNLMEQVCDHLHLAYADVVKK